MFSFSDSVPTNNLNRMEFHLIPYYPNPPKEVKEIRYYTAYKTKFIITVLNQKGGKTEKFFDEKIEDISVVLNQEIISEKIKMMMEDV